MPNTLRRQCLFGTGLSYQQQRHSLTAASQSSTDRHPRSSESLRNSVEEENVWTVALCCGTDWTAASRSCSSEK
ncbi:hypothetical protein FQN60_018703 [Etheostoma spectabile]|uniref:Uncharacterized protein n=1 Tax=Etheostoma spectabile TaxID=54343 RepID=A0A5J5CES1_9PERO|nr:hypothetical protein FQN60_018703 [Etheostoma spectabile]